ncbi:hypothetical protein [Psychromonas sp. SP041]|uniref:hypothetical protein n=1 Tax=Psychromonas sp. SP041 TaxID=1365007 RepID=UPI0004015DD3|nr:hypothetical protein [Psychromonas sp. SP041]
MHIDGVLKVSFMPRDYSGDDSNICNIDVEAIKEIAQLYSVNNMIWDEIEYSSTIDWNKLIDVIEDSYDENGRFYTEIDGSVYKVMAQLKTDEDDSELAPIELAVKIAITDNENPDKDILAFKKLLMDVFLIANLSVPGILDLFNARLDLNGEEFKLQLSNFYFQYSVNAEFEKEIAFPTIIQVSQVKVWFDSLNIGLQMKSEHSIERSLFSLLHICRMEADISMVSWIFHALEAIYGTKAGRGFNDIKEKAVFLLSVPINKQKTLGKKLRELNDLRSSFIHGGYKVAHPLDFETEDRIFDLTNFGVALIICSIQQLISKGWIELTVTEVYSGITQKKS